MSTIIQTCLESQFMETSSQVLKLKVPIINNRDEFNHIKILKSNICGNATLENSSSSSRSTFLQFLSNISSTPKEIMEKENNVYFHPLSKSTSSRLSEKSLQLCTENLGCETGSFMMMDANILSLSSPPSPYYSSRKEQVVDAYSYSSIKKVKSYSPFPPPLTTMSGEKSLQITTNREGGRLITKAVEIPFQESCFVADRSHGRLRLRVFKDFGTNHHHHDVDHVQVMSPQENENENETMMYKEDLEQHDRLRHNDEDDADAADADSDADADADDDDDDDDDDGENCKQIVMSKEIVVGSSYDIVEVEKMGKEKFPRSRLVRCKECSKGLSNWEPLWVATS